MLIKCTGIALVVLGCAGTGFSLARGHGKELRLWRSLIAALDYMQCELNYRLTPLPQLCRITGTHSGGEMGAILLALADELDKQIMPDVTTCMQSVLKCQRVPGTVSQMLLEIGDTLGAFDLLGQVASLRAQRERCAAHLDRLLQNKEERMRSYRTLGVCAGAALSILLL